MLNSQSYPRTHPPLTFSCGKMTRLGSHTIWSRQLIRSLVRLWRWVSREPETVSSLLILISAPTQSVLSLCEFRSGREEEEEELRSPVAVTFLVGQLTGTLSGTFLGMQLRSGAHRCIFRAPYLAGYLHCTHLAPPK